MIRERVGSSFVLSVFFLLSWPAMAFPLDNAQTRTSLRGLEGIYVIVEDLKPDVEEDGLTRRQIEVEVMKRLKTAGIKMLSEEAFIYEGQAEIIEQEVAARKVRGSSRGGDRDTGLQPRLF